MFSVAAIALIVSLACGSSLTLIAGDRHRICVAKQHACATSLVVARCCCGSHGIQANDLARPGSRVDDSDLAQLSRPAVVPEVLLASTQLLALHSQAAPAPPVQADFSILFGVLRL